MKQTLVSFNSNNSIDSLIFLPTVSSCCFPPQFMQLKHILLTVVIILVRLPFFLCRLSYQFASRGRGVKREENRKFVMTKRS